jgi:transposase-like protein
MAVRMLLEGLTMKAAARRLGVNPHTLTRWSADTRFQAEVRRQAERAAPTNVHISPQNPTRVPPAADKTNPPPATATLTPAERLLRAFGLDDPS